MYCKISCFQEVMVRAYARYDEAMYGGHDKCNILVAFERPACANVLFPLKLNYKKKIKKEEEEEEED